MENFFYALADTLIPWIEDRFGTVAAWIAAAAFITLPIVGIVAIAFWLAAW